MDFVKILNIDPNVLMDKVRKSKERINQLEKEGNIDELNKEQRKFEVYSRSLGNHLHNANLETNNIHEL